MNDNDWENDDDIKRKIEKLAIEKLVGFAEKELTKKHGSKVKNGDYKGCKITLIGTTACISLGNEYIALTDEYVQKITFVKKKHKIDHTYYYYELKFRDGKISYVRMRRKYRDAMFNHCPTT